MINSMTTLLQCRLIFLVVTVLGKCQITCHLGDTTTKLGLLQKRNGLHVVTEIIVQKLRQLNKLSGCERIDRLIWAFEIADNYFSDEIHNSVQHVTLLSIILWHRLYAFNSRMGCWPESDPCYRLLDSPTSNTWTQHSHIEKVLSPHPILIQYRASKARSKKGKRYSNILLLTLFSSSDRRYYYNCSNAYLSLVVSKPLGFFLLHNRFLTLK